MKIWVDADACPGDIKEILFRAAKRTGVQLTLVANHAMRIPSLPNITFTQVTSGFDVADNFIVQKVAPNDLVITSDIPLSAEVIEKGALALTPRGDLNTVNTIRAKLNMRDFMETMRASGIQTGGPPPLGQREKQAFANHLDRLISQHHKAL